METKFKIGQQVWIMWANGPRRVEVLEISIYRTGIFYKFRAPMTNDRESTKGIYHESFRSEEKVSKTLKGLQDIVFKQMDKAG